MLTIDNILLPSGLYIVSTPIGNLKDITLRALSILKSSDIIACEDTRITKKLLSSYEIKSKKLVSVHDYTSEQKLIFLINKIKKGESIALVSDSGTPVISDPGVKLIILAIKNDIKIIGKRLLKNKNNARAPRNTYDVSVIPKNELLIILGSIMKNVEPIIAYFVGTNLVHKRYTGIIVKTEITTVNMRWM